MNRTRRATLNLHGFAICAHVCVSVLVPSLCATTVHSKKSVCVCVRARQLVAPRHSILLCVEKAEEDHGRVQEEEDETMLVCCKQHTSYATGTRMCVARPVSALRRRRNVAQEVESD